MHTGEFERLRGVIADAEEPLTAREIAAHFDDAAAFDNPHRVATVLGRRADHGDVEVLGDSPYRYRLPSRRSLEPE